MTESKSKTQRVFWGRRLFLLDRAFQLKYAGILALIGMLVVGFSSLVQEIFRAQSLSDLALPSALRLELATRHTQALWVSVGVSAATAIGLGLLGIVITHRIAGPVFAMSQFAAALARGRYPLIRPLRKGDELRDFYDLFQKSVDSLRAREVEEIYRLEEALQELCGPNPQVVEVVGSLRQMKEAKLAATGRMVSEVAKPRQSPAEIALHTLSNPEVGG
ncbi:MAG TPA: signal protein [Myxococcaceae bacterium]|nr:signal protein [Myxococcaceae bacterium]